MPLPLKNKPYTRNKNTGFLRLDRIVVPLGAMLGKYQHVTEDGVYVKADKKTNDKLHYATMMFTRGGMIRTSGGMLSRAATIAVRYSCVRTQVPRRIRPRCFSELPCR